MSGYPTSTPVELLGNGSSPGQINIYNTANTNSIALRSPTGLASDYTLELPASAGATGNVLVRTGATTTEFSGSAYNTSQTLPISLNFSNPTNGSPASTTSNTYVSFATFVYQGTNADNIPDSVSFAVATSNTTAMGQIRILDITNSLTIAESGPFGPTNTTPIIVTPLIVLNNLPTGPAIWEIDLRKANAGGGNAQLFSVQIIG